MSDLAKSVLILCGMAAGVIAVWIFASAMEARSFERITGKHVTTWEAMWCDMRVQEPVGRIER